MPLTHMFSFEEVLGTPRRGIEEGKGLYRYEGTFNGHAI